MTWAERVNRERGRELEFEEILGYHLEQAYQYRTELGVIDDHGPRRRGPRAAEKLSSAGRRALGRTDMPAAANLLARAAALLPQIDPLRVEVLLDLAEARIELGQLESAGVAALEAHVAAGQIGDERLLARAVLGRAYVQIFAAGLIESGDEDQFATVRDVITSLEAAQDHAGLARAWRVQAMLSSRAGRYDDVARAAERLIEHAVEASDERLVARGSSGYANQAVWSSQPASELATRIEGMLERVHGDRKAEANIALALAQLQAMQGEIDRARELYRRGQGLLQELGPSIAAITTSIASSRVELLAGSLDAAEAELRRDEAALAELDERYYRPSIAGALARVLLLGGRVEEAEQLTKLVEELAEADDTDPQVLWRSVRSRVLALRGDADEALRLIEEAIDLTGQTEDVILKADALVDQSAVLATLGRAEEAGKLLAAALELYEKKGDVISAERIRRELAVAAS